MPKLLFINPSYKASYVSPTASILDPVFPTVGLLSLAAVAEKAGYEVAILDLSYQIYNWRVVADRLRDFKPDIVGLTGTTPLMNQIRDMSVLIKEQFPHILVVAGGAHVSALPKESLAESLLDVVVMGEGEATLGEICQGVPLEKIAGICYRDASGLTRQNPCRDFIPDLDQLPFPAWHLFDAQEYKNKISRILTRRVPSCMVEFSRGCLYTCDFCASKITMGHGYRKKSPQRCAAEVRRLYEYGWREFALTDDIFTSDKEWAKAVCQEIIKAKLDIIWTCTNGIRVESADTDLFRLMRQAGCYRVSFGLESGDESVLKAFGKGGAATLAQGKSAVQKAKKAGLDVSGFFLLGLSPDTEDSMRKTIEYASRLPLDMLKFGIAIGFPGTRMFYEYQAKGLIKSFDWEDYNVYTTRGLFAHPNLKFETVQEYVAQAYQKVIFGNPGFILRRIFHSLLSGDLYWDGYYGLKLALAHLFPRPQQAAQYYAPDRWPKYDFFQAKMTAAEFRKVKTAVPALNQG
ncbi:MAG: cobalamin-dependent protein [Candidatus Omnitrophica bacterium]|nr:cobalamin-dependent protein [Candidatus Omnitrophota bacterium]